MVDEFGAQLNVIGKSNLDFVAMDIIKGEFVFAEDITRPGKLYGRVLGSKYAKAKVMAINTAKAEAMAGVKAVITYKDVSTWSDELLCVGQPVAAVAAVDEDTAERALDLIEATYDVQVPVIDPDEALKPTAANTGVFPNTNITPTRSQVIYGDVVKGFTEADVTLEEEVGYIARHTHNEIEPDVSVGWWEGNDYYCWITTQNAFSAKVSLCNALAASLKIPIRQSQVHVYCHGTGGGFGGKGGSQQELVAALLSRKAGKPVVSRLSRTLYSILRNHQYGVKAKIKLGAKNDGTLTAIESNFWSEGGRNGGRGNFGDVAQSTWKCANFLADNWGIATNKGHAGTWRCVAHPAGAFLSDIVLEKMAARLKMNPLEFRRKIFLTEPIYQQTNRPLFSSGLIPCLNKAAELIGYTSKYHEPGARTLPDGRLHGIGIHAHYDGHGSMSGARGGIVNMCEDGTALIVSGSTRIMGGPGAQAAIVAETIGLSYDSVRCGDWGNTDVSSEGGMQAGSTLTISIGAAMMEAANDVRRQLFAVAGSQRTNMLKLWANTVDDKNITDQQMDMLDANNNRIFTVADPTKSVTHAQVMAAIAQPVIGRGVRWEPILRKPVGNFAVGGTGVHRTGCASGAEVAVDPDTGQVELLNFVNVVDFGRVIDRISSEGQILAGVPNGYNQAIYFEDVYDPITGILLGYNHIHDRMCTSLDIPEEPAKTQYFMVETIDANGPYGCHGVGEPATGTFMSINNAINHAIGKWILSTPATPRTILRALGKG